MVSSRDRCYDFKNIFVPKLVFLSFLKNLDNIFFKENAILLAQKWRKSQKIVIITSTPDGSTRS
jgi:hypothetical protein